MDLRAPDYVWQHENIPQCKKALFKQTILAGCGGVELRHTACVPYIIVEFPRKLNNKQNGW
jgi:hypothetical protein